MTMLQAAQAAVLQFELEGKFPYGAKNNYSMAFRVHNIVNTMQVGMEWPKAGGSVLARAIEIYEEANTECPKP